jgi:phosphoenolpyruvate carboxykinase (ATP)
VLLGQRIDEHRPALWLVNTGWSGGAYGTGRRMPIKLTRAVVTAILDGSLGEAPTLTDPIFGFQVPTECPNVPSEVLQPKHTWRDAEAFEQTARRLARSVAENFREFEPDVSREVASAGPRGWSDSGGR